MIEEFDLLRQCAEEDNEHVKALMYDCLAHGELGLARITARVVLDLEEEGELDGRHDDKIDWIRKTLKEVKEARFKY